MCNKAIVVRVQIYFIDSITYMLKNMLLNNREISASINIKVKYFGLFYFGIVRNPIEEFSLN